MYNNIYYIYSITSEIHSFFHRVVMQLFIKVCMYIYVLILYHYTINSDYAMYNNCNAWFLYIRNQLVLTCVHMQVQSVLLGGIGFVVCFSRQRMILIRRNGWLLYYTSFKRISIPQRYIGKHKVLFPRIMYYVQCCIYLCKTYVHT